MSDKITLWDIGPVPPGTLVRINNNQVFYVTSMGVHSIELRKVRCPEKIWNRCVKSYWRFIDATSDICLWIEEKFKNR